MSVARPSFEPHAVEGKALSPERAARLESLAYEFGRTYDSYLATQLDRQYFWCAQDRGVIGFVRQGKYVLAAGGLLGPQDAWEDMVRDFMEYGRRKRYVLSFFNIDPEVLPVFAKLGFQITKIGEDTLIDLRTRTWRGKELEWVRRQSNFCRRQGLACQECAPATMPATEWEALAGELESISRDFLRSKPHGSQMRLFVSHFRPRQLQRQRLFVARADQGAGRAEGFVLCTPGRNGTLWSFETFRQRADATRGVIPFLMHEAMLKMQHEGAELASLCLLPLIRCETPRAGDSPIVRWCAKMGYKYFDIVYDTPGLFHFKTRFRPQFEDRFLCAYPKATLLSVRALIMQWGADRFNPLRVAWRFFDRWRKRKSRRTMARPEDDE